MPGQEGLDDAGLDGRVALLEGEGYELVGVAGGPGLAAELEVDAVAGAGGPDLGDVGVVVVEAGLFAVCGAGKCEIN